MDGPVGVDKRIDRYLTPDPSGVLGTYPVEAGCKTVCVATCAPRACSCRAEVRVRAQVAT